MELNKKEVHILLIAEKLFAEKGFDGTSVRNIAKAAEVNLAMISYYFGSKEKMLDILFLYRISDFKMQLESILSQDLNFSEKIDALVALAIKRVHRNRQMYKIIQNESSNEHRKVDYDKYVAQKKENFQFVEKLVKQGQDSGKFSKNVNISLIIPTILGTYFNFFYNQRFFWDIHGLPKEKSLDDYVAHVLTPHVQRTIKALLTYED